MFTCRNGSVHQHENRTEARICWGLITRPTPPPPVIRPVVEPSTPAQRRYVGILGGDMAHAATLGKGDCSKYIDDLKTGKAVTTVTTPAAAPTRSKKTSFVISLIDQVHSGYYAVQKEEGATVDFIRVSRPKHGNFKGSIKVQTIHGPNMQDVWTYFPNSDKIWIRHGASPKIEDDLLLIYADWQGCAMRYARIIGKCCRCNLRLTDDRSRHYGIGPDCEQVWPQIIDRVNDQNDGLTYEQLRSRGA